MAPSYPLTLDVAGRHVVVVGGGPVAARRSRALVTEKAEVYVVAPALCEDLADLAQQGRVEWQPRDYVTGDLDGAWLVHTATGDRLTDDLVAADADEARIWCARADDAAQSAAWTPAAARAGDVLVPSLRVATRCVRGPCATRSRSPSTLERCHCAGIGAQRPDPSPSLA